MGSVMPCPASATPWERRQHGSGVLAYCLQDGAHCDGRRNNKEGERVKIANWKDCVAYAPCLDATKKSAFARLASRSAAEGTLLFEPVGEG